MESVSGSPNGDKRLGRRGLAIRAALLGAAAASALLGRPAVARQAQRSGPLNVLATIAMIGDLVRQIGGDRIRVDTLMGAGVDPHLYKATREDVARMLRADVIFYNGLVLEGKMSDAIIRVARSGKPVYAVTELLPENQLIEPEGADGLYDPHVWMDPRTWSRTARLIADRLADQDRANATTFQHNLATLLAKIAELDAYAEKAIASIPERQRLLVTAHDAFSYFARRYNIEVLGIQGLSTESEAGVRRIQEVVSVLVARRIPAVFVETSVSDRNVQALIEGARAHGHKVTIGGELFSDAMGEPGSYEGTYVGMIDHNVTTVVRALGGQAPERGFQNRLGSRA
jgi:manganese/zinc/iron transport system substrate-binding protein